MVIVLVGLFSLLSGLALGVGLFVGSFELVGVDTGVDAPALLVFGLFCALASAVLFCLRNIMISLSRIAER